MSVDPNGWEQAPLPRTGGAPSALPGSDSPRRRMSRFARYRRSVAGSAYGRVGSEAEWRLPGNGHNEADSGAWEVDRSFRTESDAPG
jgi:hypothetical protein